MNVTYACCLLLVYYTIYTDGNNKGNYGIKHSYCDLVGRITGRDLLAYSKLIVTLKHICITLFRNKSA